MPYKANLIRASNVAGASNYNRRNLQPHPVQFLPPLPPGYVYYAIQQDVQVQISVIDGAIAGHGQRLSAETISTLHELQRRAKRGRSSEMITSIYSDKSSPGFDWLLEGWLAEKRILSEINNYYWVYYDPLGRQYRSKQQVARFWKEQDYYCYYSSANEKATKAK